MLGSKMVISKSTAMIISYSRISRKTFTERKIGSKRTSESRTKATCRRAEPSCRSACRRAQPSRRSARRRAVPPCGFTRPASSAISPVSSPASSAVTRVGSPGELNLILACPTYFDFRIFRIAVISDLRDHILLVLFRLKLFSKLYDQNREIV
ncbi:hypothetical protein F2Q69_00047569 [Brassica cretica]|uniref:Uncharacterized protein n=1 Tax=Brassica cretica TaxID=69181 RepID=A0A8S9PG40_BRACR|nr:hypothetical protein F2Q69_00047569 [Brassica cretica]